MKNRARKTLAVAVVATLSLGGVALAGADAAAEAGAGDEPPSTSISPRERYHSDAEYRGQVQAAQAKVRAYQASARKWRDARLRTTHRPPAYYSRLPRSFMLRVEQNRVKAWRGHFKREHKAYLLEQRWWDSLNLSMWRAVEAAAREYGVSASWLHNCISTEGGHGGWVMNHQGSGAGGWAQFMESTFYGNVYAARKYRGKDRFPKRFIKWDSRVGQAYTMAYMFKIGQSGQWTGAGC